MSREKSKGRCWVCVALLIGWCALIGACSGLLVLQARAQITPGANPGHIVSVWETIAQANTAQANIGAVQIQTLQTLVVAEHAQACLMASEQMSSFFVRKYRRGELAWKSLNCQAFFEATSDAHKRKAVEEAQ